MSEKENAYKTIIEKLLAKAGVRIGGEELWDIHVHDERFYARVLSHGSIGLGEAYMDGWWDVPELDQFFYKVLCVDLEKEIKTTGVAVQVLKAFVSSRLLNAQRKTKAFEVAQKHYDIGNDLYEKMLDRRLTYTCGYWMDASGMPVQTLDLAQEAKMDLMCRKIGLKAGETLLDIGCGWGSFMKFAAEKYGARCVGVTISKEQIALGEKLCVGLPIEFHFMDYRDIPKRFPNGFDKIVSAGMFEHVGYKNYKAFFDVVRSSLADDGLFLLHTIGTGVSSVSVDPWIDKYIFPNGMLPSLKHISGAFEPRFVMEDLHNFGAYYDMTLMQWFRNFDRAWPALRETYGDRFYRMWKYYLLSCAGCFRARKMQLWQIVFSKHGVPGGYTSVR